MLSTTLYSACTSMLIMMGKAIPSSSGAIGLVPMMFSFIVSQSSIFTHSQSPCFGAKQRKRGEVPVLLRERRSSRFLFCKQMGQGGPVIGYIRLFRPRMSCPRNITGSQLPPKRLAIFSV